MSIANTVEDNDGRLNTTPMTHTSIDVLIVLYKFNAKSALALEWKKFYTILTL